MHSHLSDAGAYLGSKSCQGASQRACGLSRCTCHKSRVHHKSSTATSCPAARLASSKQTTGSFEITGNAPFRTATRRPGPERRDCHAHAIQGKTLRNKHTLRRHVPAVPADVRLLGRYSHADPGQGRTIRVGQRQGRTGIVECALEGRRVAHHSQPGALSLLLAQPQRLALARAIAESWKPRRGDADRCCSHWRSRSHPPAACLPALADHQSQLCNATAN